MADPILMRRCGWLIVLSLCMLSPLGCNRGPKMAKVSGKVLYKDGKVPQGPVAVVRFNPTGESTAEVKKGASGTINPDGTFELFTRVGGDGVYLGEYAATFFVMASGSNRNAVAPKYANPGMTPYKVVVDGNKTDLSFEIEQGTPGAAAPAAESAGAVPN
jgi:hypothetical protein